MSPIYQDNFAMLMHLKRQETETATNSNVSTPAPTSTRQSTTPAASTSTTPPATTSTPTSTSQPPTSTSTSTTVPTLTLETTSSVVTTTSSIPTSTSLATTSSVPSSTLLPTTAPTTTPRTTALVTSTVPSSLSRTTLNIPPTIIRTTSDGQIFTVTAVVGSTESANAQGSAKKPFFQNTGAVVGVFVVVGIVAMALAVMLVTMFIRKRRAKQFDREVQEAAREAAHAHAPIEDDDDYAGAQSYNTHGSQPMSTERPGGYGAYGAAASSWDPYARGAAPGATGYEMHNRRTSAGVGAGYGATDQYNQGYGQGYAQGYGQDTYNTGYGQGYGQQTYQNAAPQNYALAQPQNNAGRAPVQAQMMMPEAQRHSYNTVGAFRQSPSFGQAHPGEQVEYGHAGYDDRYPPLPQQTQQPGQGGQVDEYAPRPSEDAYGGYLPYEAGPSNQSQGHGPNPPAYVAGPTNAGATGDRKGSLGREPSGRSGATRYSQDDDVDEEPRRVLKVANE